MLLLLELSDMTSSVERVRLAKPKLKLSFVLLFCCWLALEDI